MQKIRNGLQSSTPGPATPVSCHRASSRSRFLGTRKSECLETPGSVSMLWTAASYCEGQKIIPWQGSRAGNLYEGGQLALHIHGLTSSGNASISEKTLAVVSVKLIPKLTWGGLASVGWMSTWVGLVRRRCRSPSPSPHRSSSSASSTSRSASGLASRNGLVKFSSDPELFTSRRDSDSWVCRSPNSRLHRSHWHFEHPAVP